MVAAVAALVAAIATVLFLIATYFTTLTLGVAPGLSARLGSWLRVCGADGSTCSIVARTSYARLFGGVPNAVFGMAWSLALIGLAGAWLVVGRLFVPLPYALVAGATVLTGFVLVYALLRILHQKCTLCMTSHGLHLVIALLLFWLRLQ